MRTQTSKGFTLVELMVVIAVVAILAVVAMPSYRELMDNYRVRKAGEDVISLIANARSGAVKLHRQVNVSFPTAGTGWCAGANAGGAPTGGAQAGAAAACNCTTASACTVAAEELVIPVGKHPGVSLGAGSTVVFNGVTGATVGLAGGTVTLDSPLNKFTATVTVTPLGQASLAIAPK